MRPIRRRSSPAASTSHCVKVGVPPPAACLCRTRCFVIASCEAVTCAARCRARFIPRTCCSRACHSLDKACPAPWQTGAPPRTSCARPCRLARLTARGAPELACAACTGCCTIYIFLLPAGTAIKGSAVGGAHRWRARGHDDGRAARASSLVAVEVTRARPRATGGRPTRGRCSRPKGSWPLRERRAPPPWAGSHRRWHGHAIVCLVCQPRPSSESSWAPGECLCVARGVCMYHKKDFSVRLHETTTAARSTVRTGRSDGPTRGRIASARGRRRVCCVVSRLSS